MSQNIQRPTPVGHERRCFAVGMSGGLDSSVAAALLLEQGHAVIGLTANLWREGSRCGSMEDVTRALKVAEFLQIPHYVVNAIEFFSEMIVHPFVNEYVRGRTPSPCVRCNQLIKFGVLLRDAIQLGCTHITTGHYARIEKRADGFHLLKGLDLDKDQSYFLHRLDQAQLEHILFPLGDLTKPQVMEYAKQKGLPVNFDSESQDLCFIGEEGYVPFLEKRRPDLRKQGPIVDTAGLKIGRHNGYHRFTIGQREGLGVSAKHRLYVKEVHPETNTVVVSNQKDVMCGRCLVEDVHWISGRAPSDEIACVVKLRYRHQGVPAIVHPLKESRVEVILKEDQFAVTPGQAAVFCDGDEVLGGGWIV
jgi:tRNA-specific 2-thiouridylase